MAWIRIEESSAPQEEGKLQHSPEWLGFGLIAIFVSFLLAMIATLFLVAYDPVPIPNDDAIHLGLLGFSFIVFLDFFLIYRLAGNKIRNGQSLAAAKRLVGLILLGLLVASLVGLLPWALRWLIAYFPWIPVLLRVFFWLIIAAELIWVWKVRRARRST